MKLKHLYKIKYIRQFNLKKDLDYANKIANLHPFFVLYKNIMLNKKTNKYMCQI